MRVVAIGDQEAKIRVVRTVGVSNRASRAALRLASRDGSRVSVMIMR